MLTNYNTGYISYVFLDSSTIKIKLYISLCWHQELKKVTLWAEAKTTKRIMWSFFFTPIAPDTSLDTNHKKT